MSKNDKIWESIFESYDVINTIKNDGAFFIHARDIKRHGREPRLMTKFDHKVNLPKIFVDNNLSILPVTRGEYVISSFEAYQKLDEPFGKVEHFVVPEYIQTLSQEFIVSEAIALNCANACGIMNDFLEDDDLVPTISGRMGSDIFSFDILSGNGIKTVNVSNSQIEIDASYEGVNYFSIFEAKQDLAEDFLVRQLYYPFKAWERRVSKPIKTVFLVYSNGIFNLYQYAFEDPNLYNSAKLIKFKRYSITKTIGIHEIQDILEKTNVVEEAAVPFPQANSMPRIINLLELLTTKNLSSEEITSEYDFDKRQTSYYTDALKYLGLAERYREESRVNYRLTNEGTLLMKLSLKERQLKIVELIVKHKPFNNVLRLCLSEGKMPHTDVIERIMKESSLYNVGTDSTYHRRASTIISWLNWIIGLCEE